MNKKISTLMAGGFLLTSVFASAQLVLNEPDKVLKIADKVEAGESYLVIQSEDSKLDGDDRILSVVADDEGNLTYKAYTLGALDGDLEIEKANVLWTIGKEDVGTGVVKTPYYTLKNAEANIFLSHNSSMQVIGSETALDGADTEGPKDVYSYFMTATEEANAKAIAQGGYLYSKQESFQLQVGGTNSTKVVLGTQNDDCKLYFCVYAETTADIAKMNDTMGGEGFALTFEGDDKAYETFTLKDRNLKAFEVVKSIPMGKGEIPVGTYLATAYPDSLIGKNVIYTKAGFESCTFIAVDPDVNYDIHEADRASGIGFVLKEVKGDGFNYYGVETNPDEKELSEKGEVYVGNANFSITIPNPLTEPEKYQLKLADIRVLAKTTDTQHTYKKDVFVGSITDISKNYLVTNDEGVTFETTNSTLYYPTGLLNATDAPAIYTIKFVSGEEKEGTSEYGLNLTIMAKNTGFQPVAVAQADANDPLYQFVIASVDTDNRTVTFHNRQTKAKMALSLYHAENDPENVYTVFQVTPASGFMDNDVYVEEADGQSNQKLKYTNTIALHKTKIQLTKIGNESIDKFATFMNREEGAGVVKFRLGRTEEADAVFYAGADRSKKDEIKTGTIQAWVDYADNFELIKSKDSVLVLSKDNYVYLFKDDADNTKDVWRKSVEKDTVAYYTYKIKLFDGDKDYYVKAVNNGYPELAEGVANATDFIIKENVDGSSSLILANDPNNSQDMTLIEKEAAYAWVLADDDDKDAWQMQGVYTRPNASLRTYIEEESGAISLEPVAQHVSFEATEGGFISAKDGEGKIAIANEVTDELKFWVEPQDDKVNIPSFYISNAGRFMYYAEDSAKYAVQNKDKYVFGSDDDVKLIFKAGELIDANTLQTTVDNKLVNVVAENANPAKDEKAGLKNFDSLNALQRASKGWKRHRCLLSDSLAPDETTLDEARSKGLQRADRPARSP